MRRFADKETEEDLLRVLAAVDEPGKMGRLLKEVLTDTEYGALCRRWAILRLLERGLTQRAIAGEIGGSLCNVTRGARILRNPRSIAAEMLRREAACGAKGAKA